MTFRLHDLAVLRAVAQGVTPEAAVERYVPDAHADARVSRSHVHRLTVDVCALVAARGDQQGAQALRACLTPSAEASSEQQLPSLAEFAEEINGEDLSERELQALYDERFATGHRSKNLQHQQTLALAALVRVQQDAAVHPAPNDPLLRWFKPSLAKPIQAALAVVTLQQLADAIGRFGPTWHRVVPGVGRSRAHRISQWLPEMSIGSPQPTAIAAVQPAGIRQWPTSMPTASRQPPEQGLLRTTGPNALGTLSDPDALRVWLGTLGFRSALTRRAYACDLERLLMWASERGKSLSSLTVDDATEHVKFLMDPPAHWVSARREPRTAIAWRPMRGPLCVASTTRALAAIGHCYGFLVDTGYLLANPFSKVRAPRQAALSMDVGRSFTTAQLQLLQQVVANIAQGPRRRRIQAILALATTTGVRISEAVRRWSDVLSVENSGQDLLCLRVVGKGGKERLLPLKPSTVAALRAHQADRAELVAQGLLPWLPEAQQPLISIICRPPGGAVQDDGALSAAGLHAALKRFLHEVASQAPDAATRQTFQRASFHFLRHTFAHQVLQASGQNLPVTQQLLGHSSLATTGIYVKASVAERAGAVALLPDWPTPLSR